MLRYQANQMEVHACRFMEETQRRARAIEEGVEVQRCCMSPIKGGRETQRSNPGLCKCNDVSGPERSCGHEAASLLQVGGDEGGD